MKASDPTLSYIQRPNYSESARDYCARLEAKGFGEMVIRKGLSLHFKMPVNEMAEFLEDFPGARLRHIELLIEIAPNRSEYSLIVKLSKSLGISRARAEQWVDRYKEVNERSIGA